MALERNPLFAAVEADPLLRDFARRLAVGVVFTLPIFVLAMAHMLPGSAHAAWLSGDTARFAQFLLSLPVVLWCGWPLWKAGLQSIRNASPNMFTLVLLGVGAAFMGSAPAAVVGDVVASRGGTVVAAFQMASDVGSISGPLIAGYIADGAGFGPAFATGAAVSLFGFILAATMPETLRRAPEDSPAAAP